MSLKHYTTGILNKHSNTQFAVINALNLDDSPHSIKVKALNWTNPQQSAELPVTPGSTARLQPNTAQYFNVFLPCQVTKYELRISIYDKDNVIVNCFGVSDPCQYNENLEGNTVLFNDLVLLNEDDDPY